MCVFLHLKWFFTGLVVHEQTEGTGNVAKKGAVCMIKYTGRLKSNNKVFDSNAGPRESPLKMVLGKGDVIPGERWYLMRQGGGLTDTHMLMHLC